MHHSSTRLFLLACAAHAIACGTVNGSDQEPDPGPTELCTAADVDLDDEDADGAIDEGCPWTVSAPHWMPAAFGTPWAGSVVDPSTITADGDFLVVIASETPSGQRQAWTMKRTGDDFAAPQRLAGADLDRYSVNGVAVSADLLTLYVSARVWPGSADTADDDNDLYVARRDSADAAFGALEALTALSDAGLSDDRPALSADGAELVFARGFSLMHALADDQGAFTSPRPLEGLLEGELGGPVLSSDRRTLLFSYSNVRGGAHSLYRAERSDPDGERFDPPVQLNLGSVPVGAAPVLSEATGELFFSSGGDRSWGPNTVSLWRSRLCRDGKTCELPAIECPEGVRSPDGLHCYTGSAEMMARSDARAYCQRLGGDLVSIQSQDEQELVWAKFGDRNRWLGAFDDRDGIAECNRKSLQPGDPLRCWFGWESGEAATYERWAPNEPSDAVGDMPEDCTILWYDDPEGNLHHGAWNDVSCTFGYAVVCEAVLFPTW